jgi:RNA 2',3'-cyclic 3'-phosphodiesterase
MKRLFTAVRISPDAAFLGRFRALQGQLRHERIKWVEENNIHITLKFFGETEEKKIPEIMAVQDRIAGRTRPFRISLRSTGIFGSRYDPRVIWAGIEPYEELASLMQVFRNETAKIGFVPDRQNLVPHLTVGRIKDLRDKELFQRVIGEYRDLASAETEVKEFHLYESILRKEGPLYIVQKSFILRG